MHRVHAFITLNPKIESIYPLGAPRKSVAPVALHVEPDFLCLKFSKFAKNKNSSKLGQNW